MSIQSLKNELGKLEARLTAAQDRKRAAQEVAAESVDAMVHASAERREELERQHSEAVTSTNRAGTLVAELSERADAARIALAEAELEAAKAAAAEVKQAQIDAGARLQEANAAVSAARRDPEAHLAAQHAQLDAKDEVRKAKIAYRDAGEEVRAAQGMIDALNGMDPRADYYDTYSEQLKAAACLAAREKLVQEGVQPPVLDPSKPKPKSAFAMR